MTEKKKIIIDEDWKSQVEAEKKAFEQDTGAGKQQAAEAAEGAASMPPASFEMLLTTLATEAMMSLGQVPHPASGQLVYQPHQAKYLIDTIEMLRDKTKGNLDPVESQALDNLLHQLRMAYLAGPPASSAGEESAAAPHQSS